MKINPFRPNSPTQPGMFVGRFEEILRIESALIQTQANKSHSFLLLGERGIGKTSLFNLVKFFSEGKIEVRNQNLNFLIAEVDISKETTMLTLIKKIQIALERKLAQTERTKKTFSEIWSFVKTIEAAGIKVNDKNGMDDEMLFEQFTYSIADTLNRITKANDRISFDASYDGIVILIDEADNASPELNLGSFIKLLLERLQKEGSEKLAFGIAGLPKTKDILKKSHPSSLRIFEELNLGRLSHTEIKEVIQKTLNETITLNNIRTGITDEAERALIDFSEGFPHFIHQYGFCAFELSDGKMITEDNVMKGAFGPNGAVEAIGNRYYKDDYYNKIKEEKYRQVLNIMAESLDSWVTKQQIKAKYKGTDATLKNAIAALIKRNIIICKEGTRGTYRLLDKGFGWWILMSNKNKASAKLQ